MSGPEAVRGRLPRCTPRPRSAPRVAARHPLSGTAVSVRETRVARAPPAWACRERRPAQVRRPPRVRMLHASLPTQDNKTLQHNLRRKRLRRVASHSAPTSPQVRPDGHSCAETEGNSRAGPTQTSTHVLSMLAVRRLERPCWPWTPCVYRRTRWSAGFGCPAAIVRDARRSPSQLHFSAVAGTCSSHGHDLLR